MRRVFRCLVMVGLPLGLVACADAGNVPASQRGFFGGIGAMASGADQRNAQALENAASQSEASLGALQDRANRAAAQASMTSGQVQAAEARLATLDRNLSVQRDRLARLRARTGLTAIQANDAARLDEATARLQAETRAAAQRVGGPSAAQAQDLERRSADLQRQMDQLARSM